MSCGQVQCSLDWFCSARSPVRLLPLPPYPPRTGVKKPRPGALLPVRPRRWPSTPRTRRWSCSAASPKRASGSVTPGPGTAITGPSSRPPTARLHVPRHRWLSMRHPGRWSWSEDRRLPADHPRPGPGTAATGPSFLHPTRPPWPSTRAWFMTPSLKRCCCSAGCRPAARHRTGRGAGTGPPGRNFPLRRARRPGTERRWPMTLSTGRWSSSAG